MKIVLLGPPGSGKGTQGELLSNRLHLPRLSVGALIRLQSQKKTPIGQEIEGYMLKGLGVPAKPLMKLLGEWFMEHPEGFVVDNLIRTYEQLSEFEVFQKEHDFLLDRVFYLSITENVARQRLNVRHAQKDRPDETPEAIHARFLTFYSSSGPIFDYFRKQGIFYEIDAEGTPEEVQARIMKYVEKDEPAVQAAVGK